MKGNRSVSVYTGSLKLGNPDWKSFWKPRETHNVKLLFGHLDHILKERQHGNSCADLWPSPSPAPLSPQKKKKRKEDSTKRNYDTNSLFLKILFAMKSTVIRFSLAPRESRRIRERRPECPDRRETRDGASGSNALLGNGTFANDGKPG